MLIVTAATDLSGNPKDADRPHKIKTRMGYAVFNQSRIGFVAEKSALEQQIGLSLLLCHPSGKLLDIMTSPLAKVVEGEDGTLRAVTKNTIYVFTPTNLNEEESNI